MILEKEEKLIEYLYVHRLMKDATFTDYAVTLFGYFERELDIGYKLNELVYLSEDF